MNTSFTRMSFHRTDLINEPDLAYNQAYRSARKQVKLQKGWYIHAFVFSCAIAFFWLRYLLGGAIGDWLGHLHTPEFDWGALLMKLK